VQPKLVVVMGEDALAFLNDVEFLLSAGIEPRTGEPQRFTPTIDVLVAMNSFLAPRRWEQPVGTFLLGIASTLLAVAGILTHIQSFLNGIGDVIFPFTLIMLVDWIMVQRKSTPAEEFFERPRTFAEWVRPFALVAFLVGLAFNLWIHLVLPAGLVAQVPIPYVGALISAGVYALLASGNAQQSLRRRSAPDHSPIRTV